MQYDDGMILSLERDISFDRMCESVPAGWLLFDTVQVSLSFVVGRNWNAQGPEPGTWNPKYRIILI